MPKETQSAFFLRMVREFPGVFRADDNVLFCIICDCKAPATKKSSVKDHIETGKHKAAAALKSKSDKNQTLLTTFQNHRPEVNPFHMDLCRTFLEANVPLYKIAHPSIANLFEKYMNRPIPSDETLRKKYVPLLYDKCIADMRAKVADKCIWVTLDETQDSEQRLVANFVFGLMEEVEADSPERGKCYLLNVGLLEAANASGISAFFVDSLSLLYPEGKLFQIKLGASCSFGHIFFLYRNKVRQSAIGCNRCRCIHAQFNAIDAGIIPENVARDLFRAWTAPAS